MTRIIENGRHVGPRPRADESAPAAPPAPAREPARGPAEPEVAIGPEIRVNDRIISREQVAAEAQHHPADTPAEALQAAAHALVVRELLLLEAERLGIAAEAAAVGPGRTETAEEALIRQLLEDQVDVPTADEAACRRYYANNRRKFTSPALYEARHILLAAAEEDEAARAAAAETAAMLLAALRDRPGSFAELAAAWSACPSKESGGNLGQLSKGQTVPEFEAVLFKMEEGRIWPEPVSSRYGLHIIALDRRIEGRELPFEAVHERIAAWLEAASWSRAVAQYLSLLAGAARIEGIRLPGADSPLVQ